MGRRSAIALALCWVLSAVCWANDALSDTEHKLKSELKGKFKTLRGFPSGTVLNYDASGHLKTKPASGPWTIDGRVKVKKVELSADRLHLEAERYIVQFKGDHGEKQKHRGTGSFVVIEVDLPPSAGVVELEKLLSFIFVSDSEAADAFPDFWHGYLRNDPRVQRFHAVDKSANKSAPNLKAKPAGSPDAPIRISQARAEQLLLHREIPRYPLEARLAHVQGSSIFEAHVGPAGNVTELFLVKPVGAGLDEAAAEALSKWTYRPLLVGNKPRAFLTYIRVNFTLK